MALLPGGGNPRTATTPGASFVASIEPLSMSRWQTKITPLPATTRSRTATEDGGADFISASVFGGSASTKKRCPFAFCESPRVGRQFETEPRPGDVKAAFILRSRAQWQCAGYKYRCAQACYPCSLG